MKKQEPVTERQEYRASQNQANDLSEKLKLFTRHKVNGRMQYPYELYLESENIISFDKFGMIQVVNPILYFQMNKVESLRQYINEQEMEKMFQAFPEEREAYQEKIRAFISSFRRLTKSFT